MSLPRYRIPRQSAAIALAACAALLAGCASTAPTAQTAATHIVHVTPEAQRRLDANGADAVMAGRVKAEFLHGWRGYRQYAWGRDALKPLSNAGSDWYGESLLMTPVDALDTLLVMGLTDEADAARELIATQLSFDKDLDVKHFEIVIRLLGGLLSGYQMTGDVRLLALADDLGTRLLPAFDSPTGLPYVTVNLRTGKTSGTESNPAESGTLLLEYGTLARLTGKQVYWDKAWRALEATYAMRSPIGLVGERFDVDTGQWTQTRTHVGARIDSYYEYLWKCWQLFAEPRCKTMWDTHIAALNTHVADEVDGALWYGHVDMTTGARIAPRFGALDASPACSRSPAISTAPHACSTRRSRCGRRTASNRKSGITAPARSSRRVTRCGRRSSSPPGTCIA